MKALLKVAITLAVGIQLVGGSFASALTPEVPLEPTGSPLRLSAYSIELIKHTDENGVTVYLETPQYIELQNNSSTPVNLGEYTLQITNTLGNVSVRQGLYVQGVPGYIAPGSFVVIDLDGAVADEQYDGKFQAQTTAYAQKPNLTREVQLFRGDRGVYAKSVTLKNPDTTLQSPARLVYTKVTAEEQADEDMVVYDSPLYIPRISFPLAPIEILANPKTCVSLEDGADCVEYVKFYNPGPGKVDFEGTRLRVGTLGQAGTASNTVQLRGGVDPEQYVYFPVALTNSGGSVWLEDQYGVAPIENTIMSYPDASASSKKGKSWARFAGGWGWATPTPGGANTPLPLEEPGKGSSAPSLTPCRDDQYRSPETNRCRLIASSSSSLQPCAANQYRSLETNRCRNITAATNSSSLRPCASNQYRSPETNRCRLIASTAGSLKPCVAGQERNLETNRCRNVTGSTMPKADFPVEKIKQQAGGTIGWLAFAGVGSMAAGYGVWEWRRELGGLASKIMGLLKK